MPLRATVSLGPLLQLVDEPDLLRAVDTVAYQWLVNRPQIIEGGSDQSDPLVVNPASGNRQNAIAQVRAEHDSGSGHKPVLGQNDEPASQQGLLALSNKPKPLSNGLAKQPVLLINEVGIGEDQARPWMLSNLPLGTLQTGGIPDIVLIAQRDQIPVTAANGAFEVGGKAEVGLVLEDPDGTGGGGCEFTNDGQGAVGRPVVTHHQLIRQPGLPGNAVQLLVEKSFPVVRAHGDGDPSSFGEWHGRE